jgi:hypothetical protein
MTEPTGGETTPSHLLRADKTLDERVRQLELAVYGSPDLRMMGLIDLLPKLRVEVEALGNQLLDVLKALEKLKDTKLFWVQFIATLGAAAAAVIAALK